MTNYFDKLLNDSSLVGLYDKIHEYEDEQGGQAYHDFNHALNVASYCEKILKSLNFDDDFVCETKIAALLHDTGALQGKENHAQRSFDYAKKYLEENHIMLKHRDLVLEAIKNHGEGFDTDNVIQLVLILADKIDIKKSRISESGRQTEGVRQCRYIDDILFEISDGNFQINFVCDGRIDLDELSNYYFIKKVFKAIRAFSAKFALTPSVCVNAKPWTEFYNLN